MMINEQRDEEQPIQAEHYQRMNEIAAILDDCFKGYGFMLMIFDMNTTEGTMNYISNASRPTMCKAMLEFIERSKAQGH